MMSTEGGQQLKFFAAAAEKETAEADDVNIIFRA